MGCFLDDLRAFGINADQWTTTAQDEGECSPTSRVIGAYSNRPCVWFSPVAYSQEGQIYKTAFRDADGQLRAFNRAGFGLTVLPAAFTRIVKTDMP